MPIRFDIFRLSLQEKKQNDLFEIKKMTREEYIRKIFSVKKSFEHYSEVYHYVFAKNINDIIVGRIGRKLTTEENLPPDVGLEDYEHESWKASAIVIDPKDHIDGQKIAFQIDRRLGKPYSVLKSFINSLNQNNSTAQYHLEIAPINDEKTFWKFAEENKGNITKLSFTFVAPNMFGTTDNINNALRQMRDNEKAQKIDVTLQSDEGIETNTENIKHSINYATKGGGEIRANARGNKRYDSTKIQRQIKIYEGKNLSPLDLISKYIDRIISRE